MAEPRSDAFVRFFASVAAPMTQGNLEDYDLGALHAIAPDERPVVEQLLAERLAAGDGRAASAFVELATPTARRQLAQALGLPVAPLVRIAVARALALLGDFRGEGEIVDSLGHGDPYERKIAANALQFFKTSSAEAALLNAMRDADAGVRGNALGSIIAARGLKPYDGSYRDRIGLMYPLLGSPLESVRSLVLADVRELLAHLDAGDSPAQLELELEPIDDSMGPAARWMASLRTQEAPWQEDLALDALDALQGRARRWAEDIALGYLHLDPRAARAAAHARSMRAVEPMKEVMAKLTGAVRVEAAGAVWNLTSDPQARAVLDEESSSADADVARRARRALSTR